MTHKIQFVSQTYVFVHAHKTYISKTNDWSQSFKTVPCDTSVMSRSLFYNHILELKDVDMYHRIIYEIILNVYDDKIQIESSDNEQISLIKRI